MPEKDTAYTREGTLAHAMAEAILRTFLANGLDYVPEKYEYLATSHHLLEQRDACLAEGLDWKEMAETVYEHYCRIVYETYLGAKLEDPDAVLLIEARLRLDEFIPDGFGSSDAVIIYNDTLEVFDLKYGKGVKVDADHNPQMMCYALGALCGPGETYLINTVRMTIIQPRLRHESSWAMSADELIKWANNTLKPAALASYGRDAERQWIFLSSALKGLEKCGSEHAKFYDDYLKNLINTPVGNVIAQRLMREM